MGACPSRCTAVAATSIDCWYSPRASMDRLSRYLQREREKGKQRSLSQSDERDRPWLVVRRLDGDGVSGVLLCQRVVATLDEQFGQLDEGGEVRGIDGQGVVVELFRQFVLSLGIGDESSQVRDLVRVRIQRRDLPQTLFTLADLIQLDVISN